MRDYREKTKTKFSELDEEGKELNYDKIFSQENLRNAEEFSHHVFEASKIDFRLFLTY